MGERTSYAHGQPCYVELMTSDFDASVKLYCDLLALNPDEMPIPNGRYAQLRKDGKIVAAIGHAPSETPMPTYWGTYISVDDIEATLKQATELGGQVNMGPIEVGEHGRMANLTDSTGAVFSVWQAGDAIGCELVNDIGAWCWSEVWSTDAAKAQDFYSKLFGWSYEVFGPDGGGAQDPNCPPYFLINSGEQRIGGLTSLTKEMQGVPPHWAVYFAVADADATAEQLKAAGGTIYFGPFDGPAGRMFVAQDPQGAPISFIKTSGPMDP